MAIKIGEFDGAEQQREQVERKQSNETRPQKGASLHPTGEPGVIGIGENKSAHRKKKIDGEICAGRGDRRECVRKVKHDDTHRGNTAQNIEDVVGPGSLGGTFFGAGARFSHLTPPLIESAVTIWHRAGRPNPNYAATPGTPRQGEHSSWLFVAGSRFCSVSTRQSGPLSRPIIAPLSRRRANFDFAAAPSRCKPDPAIGDQRPIAAMIPKISPVNLIRSSAIAAPNAERQRSKTISFGTRLRLCSLIEVAA